MAALLNGRIAQALLTEVQPGERLLSIAATAWQNMVAAAQRDGVSLWITEDGAYADLAAQRIRLQNGSASGIKVSAVGQQTHGWADRVDVGSFGSKFKDGIARAAWLHANAAKYGFTFEFGAADPNHLKHDGTTTGPTTARKDTEMFQARHPNGAIALIGELTYQNLNINQYNNNIPAYGAAIQFTPEGFQQHIIDCDARAAMFATRLAGQSATTVDKDAIAVKVEKNLADDFERLAAQIAKINSTLGTPTKQEIAEAVARELAERLA